MGLALACNRTPTGPIVEANIDPKQALKQMADKLSGAPQLTFKAARHLDATLIEGSEVPEDARVEISVLRPNKVMARSTSAAGARYFYADGQKVTVLDATMNLYASAPLAGSIDEMAGQLEEKFGFMPPLAEFVSDDPYKKFSQEIETSSF
jgi:hypothetical protein